MVAPGNVKGSSVQAPPPHGRYRQPMKAAAVAAPSFGMPIIGNEGNQTSPKLPSATQNTEALHMARKVPFSPVRMGVVGFGVVASIATFVLYTTNKPEVTALDVARVASGSSIPENNPSSQLNE